MKRLLWAVCLCFIILLTGCGKEPVVELPNYTVRFVMKGNVISEQIVTEGNLPNSLMPTVQGLRFSHWVDEKGVTQNPFSKFVYGDIRYEAVAYPELSKHVPYLFADEEGYLRPEDALTADELLQALQALAAEGAEQYFPGMPLGSQSVTVPLLRQVLESFYAAESVTQALTLADDAPLTRSAFAQCMQQLLGREEGETLTIAEDVTLPKDLTRERTDTIALLEASVPHTPHTKKHMWSHVVLPEPMPQGFNNIDGWLYYVQEDYKFLKDGYVGTLYFDENGRYTSGDGELDATVAQLLKTIMEENPEAEGLTLLKAVFDHCHLNYKYLRRNAYKFGQTGWEIDDAKVMFEKGRGNCYNFAAIFWALSRGLGYETRAVSGTCTGTDQPHGWCIIEIDGSDYFFDPEWQFAYRNEGRPAKDMFMIPMNKISYWTYKWKE